VTGCGLKEDRSKTCESQWREEEAGGVWGCGDGVATQQQPPFFPFPSGFEIFRKLESPY
jgi:hypothetical protein